MPPVHAEIMDGPILTVSDQMLYQRRQEGDELRFRHFAGGHGKIRMLDTPQSAGMAGNRHVVRRIDEDHLGFLSLHQLLKECGLGRIPAQESMAAELSEIAWLADWKNGWIRVGNDIGGGIVLGRTQPVY